MYGTRATRAHHDQCGADEQHDDHTPDGGEQPSGPDRRVCTDGAAPASGKVMVARALAFEQSAAQGDPRVPRAGG